MLTMILLAAVGAGNEAQGSVQAVEELPIIEANQRQAPRLHGAVGLVAGGAFTNYAIGFGAGINGDIGVTLGDRAIFSARMSLATSVILAVASLGLAFDYALNDHLTLGAGVALGYLGGAFVTDQAAAFTVQVPLRVQYFFADRGARQVSRRGFGVFLEVAPGYAAAGSAGYRRFAPGEPDPTAVRYALMGTLGVSYAWW